MATKFIDILNNLLYNGSASTFTSQGPQTGMDQQTFEDENQQKVFEEAVIALDGNIKRLREMDAKLERLTDAYIRGGRAPNDKKRLDEAERVYSNMEGNMYKHLNELGKEFGMSKDQIDSIFVALKDNDKNIRERLKGYLKMDETLLKLKNWTMEFGGVWAEVSPFLAMAINQLEELSTVMVKFNRRMGQGFFSQNLGMDIYGNSMNGSIKAIAAKNNIDVEQFLEPFKAFTKGNILGRDFKAGKDAMQRYGVEAAKLSKFWGVESGTLSDLAGNLMYNYGARVQQVTAIFKDGKEKAVQAGIAVKGFFEKFREASDLAGKYYVSGGIQGLEKLAMYAAKTDRSIASIMQNTDKFKTIASQYEQANSLMNQGLKMTANSMNRVWALYNTGHQQEGDKLMTNSMAKDIIANGMIDKEGNVNQTGMLALQNAGANEEQIKQINRMTELYKKHGMTIEQQTNIDKQSLKTKMQIAFYEKQNMTVGERLRVIADKFKALIIDPLAAVLAPIGDVLLNTISTGLDVLGFLLKPVIWGFEAIGKGLKFLADIVNWVTTGISKTFEYFGIQFDSSSNRLVSGISFIAKMLGLLAASIITFRGALLFKNSMSTFFDVFKGGGGSGGLLTKLLGGGGPGGGFFGAMRGFFGKGGGGMASRVANAVKGAAATAAATTTATTEAEKVMNTVAATPGGSTQTTNVTNNYYNEGTGSLKGIAPGSGMFTTNTSSSVLTNTNNTTNTATGDTITNVTNAAENIFDKSTETVKSATQATENVAKDVVQEASLRKGFWRTVFNDFTGALRGFMQHLNPRKWVAGITAAWAKVSSGLTQLFGKSFMDKISGIFSRRDGRPGLMRRMATGTGNIFRSTRDFFTGGEGGQNVFRRAANGLRGTEENPGVFRRSTNPITGREEQPTIIEKTKEIVTGKAEQVEGLQPKVNPVTGKQEQPGIVEKTKELVTGTEEKSGALDKVKESLGDNEDKIKEIVSGEKGKSGLFKRVGGRIKNLFRGNRAANIAEEAVEGTEAVASKGLGGMLRGGLKGLGGGLLKGGMLGIAGGMVGDLMTSAIDKDENGKAKSTGGKLGMIGAGALQGASMGAMFGPWGAAIGGAIGGLVEVFKQFGEPIKKFLGKIWSAVSPIVGAIWSAIQWLGDIVAKAWNVLKWMNPLYLIYRGIEALVDQGDKKDININRSAPGFSDVNVELNKIMGQRRIEPAMQAAPTQEHMMQKSFSQTTVVNVKTSLFGSEARSISKDK